MFRWERSEELPQEKPSEREIWALIDHHDPHGTAPTDLRLEQYEDMLRGRSIYGDFFLRNPVLPYCELDPSSFSDPKSWVTALYLKCGEFNPLESTVDHTHHGMCEVLFPATDTADPVRKSPLLSHRQLTGDSPEWPRDSLLGHLSGPPRGYVCWARYILQAHKHTLKEAGIYSAVYASLFSFESIPPSWIRGVVKFWDTHSNTCWMGPEEVGITLWDLQRVSGLPVYGQYYEECIPPDEQLFSRQPSADGNRRGEMIMPPVFPDLLSHYRRAYRREQLPSRSRATFPADVWIESFIRRDCLTRPVVSLRDPFDCGLGEGVDLTEEFAEPSAGVGYLSPALPGIGEDLSLAGFLTTWLCIFVLPFRERSIRCGTLMMASRMSRGERISLAPAVLGRVCRVMRSIVGRQSLEVSDQVLP